MARRDLERLWRKRFAKWERFRGTVVEFCKREGVSEQTFYTWRKRLQAAATPSPLEFVELKPASSEVGAVELVTGSGSVVRVRPGFDKATLLRVLEVLDERR